jgi:hypothetical protein
MVYQDVMAGKRCKNAKDFLHLVEQKNTSILIDQLLESEIEDAHSSLELLFDKVKPVPDIQQVHSMTVLDVDKIECKIHSFSTQKTVVHF